MDYYSVLGILPDAEDVVVVAAYRALAQRYHPDKWSGTSVEAHERMARLNQAYAVLSDISQRAAYDKTRAQDFGFDDNEDDQREAFDTALESLEAKWKVACSVFPDLIEYRARLAKISTTLSFAFVTTLVDEKSFARRQELASHVERAFLERYFGRSSKLIEYGRSLIFAGHRSAAKALNELVVVLGSEVDPHLLINKIDKQFGFDTIRERQIAIKIRTAGLTNLADRLCITGHENIAVELANALGYTAISVGGSFFKPVEFVVTTPSNEIIRFKNSSSFVDWAKKTLCATVRHEKS